MAAVARCAVCAARAGGGRGAPRRPRRPALSARDAAPIAAISVPLAALCLAVDALPAHAAAEGLVAAQQQGASLPELAEWEGFGENFAKFFTFTASVFIGGTYVMIKPFIDLAKKSPLGFVAVTGGAAAALYGVKLTVEAMLGMTQDLPPI